MAEGPAKTPLYEWHAAHGGRLVDFAGWSMPVLYTSIVEEHQATRSAVGLFDISHMGRLAIHGTRAAEFLDSVVTRRVVDTRPGRIRYSLVTNHEGGILDDVLIYQRGPEDDPSVQMVVNASNREKIIEWLEQQRTPWCASRGEADAVTIVDNTATTAMIAIQGPRAIELMEPLVDVDLRAMRYYTGAATRIGSAEGLISRTGYTGEDGCEVIVPAQDAEGIWQTVLDSGQALRAQPAGLGCRDTLRLEAAMPLYGHELTEQINPVAAGLMFAVNLEDRDFPGHEAIAGFQADPGQAKRIGLKLDGRRIARQGAAILVGEETVGEVTSGTFSPTLGCPIAMGYVRAEAAAATADALEVDIRGQRHSAERVPLPFYKRS